LHPIQIWVVISKETEKAAYEKGRADLKAERQRIKERHAAGEKEYKKLCAHYAFHPATQTLAERDVDHCLSATDVFHSIFCTELL
jgi:hypothetical protein